MIIMNNNIAIILVVGFLLVVLCISTLSFEKNINFIDIETFSNPINFIETPPSINDINHIIDNFYVENAELQNGRYLNVYQNKGNDKDNNKFKSLGQYMTLTQEKINGIPKHILEMKPLRLIVSGGNRVKHFEPLWNSKNLDNYSGKDFSIWRPIPYTGFKAMGDIFKLGFEPPETDIITTLPDSIMEKSGVLKKLIWAIDYNNMNNTKIPTNEEIDGYDEIDEIRQNKKNIFCWYVTDYEFPKCYKKKYTKDTKRHDILDIMNIRQSILDNGGTSEQNNILKVKLN
jgi:hypothetical protein